MGGEFCRQKPSRVAVIAALLVALTQVACSRGESQAPTVVLVTRHAERAAVEGNDPPLSDEGVRRAEALAGVAEAAGVTAVYCTQFRRTRDTAAPLIGRTGAALKTVEVNPDNMRAYAANVAARVLSEHRGQTVVVVSHSNTVPLIIEQLGRRPPAPIGDAEYGDLYIVIIPPEGAARIVKARYGTQE